MCVGGVIYMCKYSVYLALLRPGLPFYCKNACNSSLFVAIVVAFFCVLSTFFAILSKFFAFQLFLVTCFS